jgi:hypothetical protein
MARTSTALIVAMIMINTMRIERGGLAATAA